MKTLNPYLCFGGKTAQALEFYKAALKGEIVMSQTFDESGQCPGAENASGIMHSEFRAENINFYATDGVPGQELIHGNAISLCINFNDEAEQLRVFNALADKGQIAVPLADMFWGAKFGEVIDQFGLRWMLNCNKEGPSPA